MVSDWRQPGGDRAERNASGPAFASTL